MPVAVVVFLTLFYAFASPLGIRIRATLGDLAADEGDEPVLT